MGCLPRALHARRSFSRTRLKLPRPRPAGHLPRPHGDYTLPRFKQRRSESWGSYDCTQNSRNPPTRLLATPMWAWPGETSLSGPFSAIDTQSGHGGEAGLHWPEEGSCLQTTRWLGCSWRRRNPELGQAQLVEEHRQVLGAAGPASTAAHLLRFPRDSPRVQVCPDSAQPSLCPRWPPAACPVQLRQKAPHDRLLLKGPFSSLI